MRVAILLSYKGTHYHGWQIQPNGRSIQQDLQEALQTILREPIHCLGCGRTDTGVHAREFVVHFDLVNAYPNNIVYKLNQVLNNDIAILGISNVSDDFNARFDCISRTYQYYIHRVPNPFINETSWHIRSELDLHLMNEASQLLLKYHDFECFSKVHTQVNNFNCDIQYAQWSALEDSYIFEIRANRFLRNMVRAIVGTMVEIGRGKMGLDDFEAIILSKNRSQAGESAPALGLFLTKVVYPDGVFSWEQGV